MSDDCFSVYHILRLEVLEIFSCLGLVPNCVVLVATVRAIKMHGGGPKVCGLQSRYQ